MERARVKEGLMWVSLLPHATAVKIPDMAANAHPADTTIHPPPSAFERASATSAITPLPNRTRTMVPINSPNIGDSIRFPLDCRSRVGRGVSREKPSSWHPLPHYLLRAEWQRGARAQPSRG